MVGRAFSVLFHSSLSWRAVCTAGAGPCALVLPSWVDYLSGAQLIGCPESEKEEPSENQGYSHTEMELAVLVWPAGRERCSGLEIALGSLGEREV